MSLKDTAIAKADLEILGPAIEQVRFVLSKMPVNSDLEKRDRALIAFTLLTGARDNAIASLKLKHVDLDSRSIFQDAREVRTKASKTMVTDFFPVGEDVLKIVADWLAFLKQERHWGLDDPVFPATKVGPGSDYRFQALGLERRCWKNAAQIRSIFRHAFEAAGLPYFNPHSFRNTLTRLGQQICTTPEEFKIWSQNLGHEKVMTTFSSYGAVERHRQREVMRGFCSGKAITEIGVAESTLMQIAALLERNKRQTIDQEKRTKQFHPQRVGPWAGGELKPKSNSQEGGSF